MIIRFKYYLRVLAACAAIGTLVGLTSALVLVVLSIHGFQPDVPNEAFPLVMAVGSLCAFPFVRKRLRH